MSTTTTNHGLIKQTLGENPGAWHTDVNTTLDTIDERLPRSYAGDPNSNVAGAYVGQLIWDSTNKIDYRCTTTGNAATAVWQRADQNTMPSGVITMWSGTVATIPTGWVLCDGNNSTPDLRDKFIVGARQDDSGTAKTNLTGSLTQSGGSITDTSTSSGAHDHGGSVGATTLSESQIPGHTHGGGSLSAASGGAHTHDIETTGDSTDIYDQDGVGGSHTRGVGPIGSGNGNYKLRAQSNGAHTHTISGSTGSTGGGGSHDHSITSAGSHTHDVDIVPPYYALAFIMKS